MNILKTSAPTDKVPASTGKAVPPELLHDESRMEGKADAVEFPESTQDVSAILNAASSEGKNVTISGGKTGIAGGAVPESGLLISTSKMKKIFGINDDGAGNVSISCQCGASLDEINKFIRREKKGFFFPPDPTETSASAGGMASCNASGAHTFSFGPTRNYVNSMTVVLANGGILKLKRGEAKAAPKDNSFVISHFDGQKKEFKASMRPQPATKNAAGYFSGKEIDAIDLFIGSEGTLGLITEIEFRLIPCPEAEFNTFFFLSSEAAAIELTGKLRCAAKSSGITAIEYFDPGALELLRERRLKLGPASGVPPGMPEDKKTAGIYIDTACAKKDVKSNIKLLLDISKNLEKGSLITAWAAFDKDERERLKKFRHALPETVNSLIAERRKLHPALTKLGTDMAVPDGCLEEIMKFYREKLDSHNLEYVIFGHIGNNHVHVNILPQNMEEYNLGKKLYMEFAVKVLEMKGSISAEHGIGKLKKNFLRLMLGDDGINEMKAIKKAFDPDWRLGINTLF